jgi:hypothetical protein
VFTAVFFVATLKAWAPGRGRKDSPHGVGGPV